MARRTSDFGLRMIEAFEGFPNGGKPYLCPAGVLTQGFGHTAAAGGEPLGGQWSREKARQVLRDDLARLYEPGVRRLLKRTPTQGQFDAMVSFAFNCGVDALRRSSLLKFFNRGEDAQAQGAFMLWVKAAGKTMPGLVRRRASEALAYRGFQDLDFDGRLDTGEPAYGPMPQAVDQEREKVAGSGTLQGAGTAGAGGAAVVIKGAQDALTTAEPHISAGTWIGIALGVVILAGAVYAGYRKWVDMGRPLPWRSQS
jgi:lysozyme